MPSCFYQGTSILGIVLAFIAALVPILGSLYAGTTFLIDAARADHERRVRYRIAPLVEAHMEVELSRGSTHGTRRGLDHEVMSVERARFRRMLLEANGIYAKPPTWGDHDIAVAMSMPLVPKRERQRQTVVIFTAVVGVVLLGLEGAIG